MIGHRTDVVAIVALTGEQQDGIAGPSELHHAGCNQFANLCDDFLLCLAGLPRRRLPAPHLLHTDHRQ